MKPTKIQNPKSKRIRFSWFHILGIKSVSIYQFILILLVFTSVISVALVSGVWVYAETIRMNKQIEALKENALENQVLTLKQEVSNLIIYLNNNSQDTIHHTIEQLKEESLQYLEGLRFGNDGYVFINTYDGLALLFDGKKLDEPKKMSSLNYPKGLNFYEIEMNLAKKPDGGSFQYMFQKMNDTILHPKIAYIKGFDEWGWIIGIGDYLDDVDSEIVLLEKNLKSNLNSLYLILFIVLISLVFILIFFASWLAKTIQKQFNQFVSVLKNSPLGINKKQFLDEIPIKELQTIGFDILYAEELAKQFGDIVEQSLNEIYIYRQDNLQFVHANNGAMVNCGYSLKELQEMTPLSIKPQLTESEFLKFIKPLMDKETNQVRFETVHQRKNKSLYPVEIYITASFFKDEPVFVAFIYDISERKKAELQLKMSEARYFDLFENAPISVWEEDYTEVISYLKEQMKETGLSIVELLNKHIEIVRECARLVNVTDVNKTTLALYGAKNKNELLGRLDKVINEETLWVFKNSLIALFSQKEGFSAEGKNVNLLGEELDLLIHWSFSSKNRSPEGKIIISKVDLTELRKTEKELRSSEARFRTMFENNHAVMLLIDSETKRFVDVNRAAIDYYGYTRAQFLNELTLNQINILSPTEINAKIELTKANKTGHFYLKHRLSNGEIRDVEVHNGIINFEEKKVLFAIVIDITEKKHTENALLKVMNKMDSIFRSVPVGIGAESNRVFTEVNNRFCEMVGFSAEELLGKESKIIYPSIEEYERVGKEKKEQIREKGIGSVETIFKRKDGTLINVLLNFTSLNMSEVKDGITFSALDITERVTDVKELEKYRLSLEETVKERTQALASSQDALLNLVDDLSLQSSKLEKANRRLAEINEELETFTYSVSHDLKAPLRGIDGYSQLLIEDFQNELSEEANLFLLNIRQSTQQMALLIEDLLAYSRMERKDFVTEKIQFKGFIDDMILYFSKQIEKQKITIKYSFPDNFILAADKDGLNLILRNLVDNAIKFTAPIEKPKIEIGGAENDDNWLIFVKDNGIGFDMKYHDRIFKIFQRLHLREEFEGTGIGLAMVGKAAQRMKGKTWAESELGKGATFYLEIGKIN